MLLSYQVNAGSIQSVAAPVAGTSPASQSGFDLQVAGGSTFLTDGDVLLSNSGNLALNSITGLNPDDAVTLYVTFTQDRDNPTNYGFLADNIRVDGVAIPEPSSALLMLAVLSLFLLRRRQAQ